MQLFVWFDYFKSQPFVFNDQSRLNEFEHSTIYLSMMNQRINFKQWVCFECCKVSGIVAC